ncbi:MAG: hypothetical protein R2848_11900 [Thermomicrobiales bacterium]
MRRLSRFVLAVLLLALAGLQTVSPARAQGQVYTDTMDSAETGLLGTASSTPGVTYSYQDGQFLVQASDPSFQGELVSFIGVPEMSDVRVTVDVALGGDTNNKYVLVGCRANDTSDGYMLGVAPVSGLAILFRADPDDDVVLQRLQDPALVNAGNANNQIGIDCTGNVITALINGTAALTATDSTYASGRVYIGAGASGDEIDGLAVGFDNLTVTDLSGGSNLQPTAIPAAPTLAAPTAAAPTLAVPTTAPLAPTEASTSATTQMRDPNIDPAATLADAFNVSLYAQPLVADLGGSAEVTIDNVRTLPAGVQVAEFYAELHFTTPQVPAGTYYLVGFCFWVDPAGNCYDIYVQDDGTGISRWGYGYDVAGQGYDTIQTGDVTAGTIDPTPGADNFLSITVYKGLAILSGNTFTVAAVIPLQGTPVIGDVKAEVGFIQQASAAPSTVNTLPMDISFFAVWDLSSGQVPSVGPVATDTPSAALPTATSASLPTIAPPSPTVASLPTIAPTVIVQPTPRTNAVAPTLPPLQSTDVQSVIFDRGRTTAIANAPLVGGNSGVLTQEATGYTWNSSGISAGDFYALVTFTNPGDVATPFDVGIGFRASAGTESGLRFVILSTGEWYLFVPNVTTIASGVVTNFDAAAGATNTIEVLAQGGAGLIAVNGVVLPQADLSSAAAPGDVYIGTGFFQGDSVAGRQVPYADYWVFPMTA